MAIQKNIYRSMQGKEVDMNKLVNQHELTLAVGNAKVNARGDEIGPGGKIIRKAEEVVSSSAHVPNEVQFNPSPIQVQQPSTPIETVKQTKNVKDVSNMDPDGNE